MAGNDGGGGKLAWKALGLLSAVFAGIAARKVLSAVWEKSTGTQPPTNPESPDTTWSEALAWSIASGAAIGVARMLATRKAADYWRRSTEKLPPWIEEVVA